MASEPMPFSAWLERRAAETGLLPYATWAEEERPVSALLDRTSEYARWVLAGGRVAGAIEQGACKRHLADIEDGGPRGLEWRPAEAERIIDFYPENFTITDGPAAGEPYQLLAWHLFCSGSLFGWWRLPPAGKPRWRYSSAWIETAKGQGKSPWVAATAIIVIAAMGRRRAEAYAVAPKEDQARVVLRDAGAFLRAPLPGGGEGETWEASGKFLLRGEHENVHSIVHVGSKSTLIAQGGNAEKVSGPRPAFVGVDEVHELPNGKLIDMWMAAIEKNAEGGILVELTNTPAIDQAFGSQRAAERHAIALGETLDDSTFVFACRADEADGKEDPATKRPRILDDERLWSKAMPALDESFPRENARAVAARARTSSSDRARFLRLYCGLPAGAIDFWMEDAALWEGARVSVDEAALVNLPCYLALDLSTKNDLTALSACWVDGDRRITKDWGWTVEERLAERAKADRAPYEQWVAAGHLTAVPGGAIDYEFVALQVARLVDEHDVRLLAFDPAKIADFVKACEKVSLPVWRFKGPDEPAGRGLKLVSHFQGTRVMFEGLQLCMPRSIDKLDDLIRKSLITIDDNPVSNSCAYNAAIEKDAKENRAFAKTRSRGRIDLLVSKTMAVGASYGEAKKKGPAKLSVLRF